MQIRFLDIVALVVQVLVVLGGLLLTILSETVWDLSVGIATTYSGVRAIKGIFKEMRTPPPAD